jgi:hypothetical protein
MAAQVPEVMDTPLNCDGENTGLQILTDLHISKFRDYGKVSFGIPLSVCLSLSLSHTSTYLKLQKLRQIPNSMWATPNITDNFILSEFVT